jgi:hypothetical protein
MRTLVYTASLLFVWALPALAQGPAQPGPEHEVFKKLAGKWDCQITLPGGGTASGSSTFRTELNGLHLVQEFEGNFGGLPFHGRGVTSYCPIRKKYLANWVDDMTATPTRSEGTLSDDGKKLTETGEGSDGQGGLLKIKGVTEIVSDDQLTYTMHGLMDNQETEMLKIIYRRKQ